MQFSGRIRKKLRLAGDQRNAHYPHSLQFYLQPPTENISLTEFESLAFDRVKCKFQCLCPWEVQLSLWQWVKAVSLCSAAHQHTLVICCWRFDIRLFIIVGILSITLPGGPDFVRNNAIKLYVETVPTMRRQTLEEKSCIRLRSAWVEVNINAPGA